MRCRRKTLALLTVMGVLIAGCVMPRDPADGGFGGFFEESVSFRSDGGDRLNVSVSGPWAISDADGVVVSAVRVLTDMGGSMSIGWLDRDGRTVRFDTCILVSDDGSCAIWTIFWSEYRGAPSWVGVGLPLVTHSERGLIGADGAPVSMPVVRSGNGVVTYDTRSIAHRVPGLTNGTISFRPPSLVPFRIETLREERSVVFTEEERTSTGSVGEVGGLRDVFSLGAGATGSPDTFPGWDEDAMGMGLAPKAALDWLRNERQDVAQALEGQGCLVSFQMRYEWPDGRVRYWPYLPGVTDPVEKERWSMQADITESEQAGRSWLFSKERGISGEAWSLDGEEASAPIVCGSRRGAALGFPDFVDRYCDAGFIADGPPYYQLGWLPAAANGSVLRYRMYFPHYVRDFEIPFYLDFDATHGAMVTARISASVYGTLDADAGWDDGVDGSNECRVRQAMPSW